MILIIKWLYVSLSVLQLSGIYTTLISNRRTKPNRHLSSNATLVMSENMNESILLLFDICQRLSLIVTESVNALKFFFSHWSHFIRNTHIPSVPFLLHLSLIRCYFSSFFFITCPLKWWSKVINFIIIFHSWIYRVRHLTFLFN